MKSNVLSYTKKQGFAKKFLEKHLTSDLKYAVFYYSKGLGNQF